MRTVTLIKMTLVKLHCSSLLCINKYVRRIRRQQNNTDLWYGLLHNAGPMLDTLCIQARLMSNLFLCCDYPNKCI